MRLLGEVKSDTNRVGEISEAAIITRLLQLGYVVLTPYGGNQRYDLMIEESSGQFRRIQCKSAWISEGGTVLKFDTANHNVTGKNRQMRHYRGQCDYFALYSADLGKIYLVPVDEVGITRASLRLTPPKNKNQYGYRMAADYEL
jgi:PD-(D/E)XK endonuclease